jgi:phosphatidate cytidylyltransferase
VFKFFVLAIGAGALWEWQALVRRIAQSPVSKLLWFAGGVTYVGIAMATLLYFRDKSVLFALMPVLLVIGVDIGAYFTGRTLGGPKIAPAISPSKTWSGLAGGILGAGLVLVGRTFYDHQHAVSQMRGYNMDVFADQLPKTNWPLLLIGAVVIAVVAQAGDFFESWMKRRAGVKDSGRLIPGHGGLLDRIDGMLSVLLVLGIIGLVTR